MTESMWKWNEYQKAYEVRIYQDGWMVARKFFDDFTEGYLWAKQEIKSRNK